MAMNIGKGGKAAAPIARWRDQRHALRGRDAGAAHHFHGHGAAAGSGRARRSTKDERSGDGGRTSR